MIGVPNVDSWASKFFRHYFFYRGAPVHTLGFSPKSLEHAAGLAGLEIVQLTTRGGMRGWLGSLLLYFQQLLLGRSQEPKTKLLVLLSPAYLIFFLVDMAATLVGKGHLIEAELRPKI